MADSLRPLVAEALGSAILFATVIGSGIMAQQLAGGNDAVALLGNTLATAAMLFVLITILGPISGAHFNPAVTLAVRLRGSIGSGTALAYAAAQLLGGALGVLLTHAMFNQPLVQWSTRARSTPGEWLGEGIATFLLLLTMFGTLRHRPAQVPLAVAAVITAGYWFTSSTSFANPAITLARAMTDSFSGIALADAPAFIAAQLAGALIATGLAQWLFDESASSVST
jgi:glycerol uptake facilitator-like aquaporin